VSEAEIDGSDQLPWPAVVESERVQVLRMGGPAVEDDRQNRLKFFS
jgi:hypothetical protein